MVKIRLFRTGATKRPSYRIVAVDDRRKRESRVLEFLGTYDPRAEGAVQVKQSALEAWQAKGAQMSDTVKSLLRKQRRKSEVSEAPNAS